MTTQEKNTNITNTNEPAEKKTNKKKAIGIVAVAAVTVAAVIIAMLTACGNKKPTATAIRLTTIITMPATVRQARATAHQAAQISLQAIQAQAVHQVRVNRQAVHQAAQVRASRQAAPAHHLQVSLHRLHSLQQKTHTRAKLGTMQSTKPKKFG